jgi:hypothetical protein
LTCEYLREFSKKFKMVLTEYSGAGEKLIHEKTRSKKSRDTVPLIEVHSPLLSSSTYKGENVRRAMANGDCCTDSTKGIFKKERKKHYLSFLKIVGYD